MGRSHRRAIPKSCGKCPSIAALTRSGARKASDTVMLTLRTLHWAPVAMLSVVAAGSSISSLSHRRPCAIAAISVAFVSDRMGADRSGFQRARPDALFGEGRDENHRHGATLGNQKALQLYAGHAGHLNVAALE